MSLTSAVMRLCGLNWSSFLSKSSASGVALGNKSRSDRFAGGERLSSMVDA